MDWNVQRIPAGWLRPSDHDQNDYNATWIVFTAWVKMPGSENWVQFDEEDML